MQAIPKKSTRLNQNYSHCFEWSSRIFSKPLGSSSWLTWILDISSNLRVFIVLKDVIFLISNNTEELSEKYLLPPTRCGNSNVGLYDLLKIVDYSLVVIILEVIQSQSMIYSDILVLNRKNRLERIILHHSREAHTKYGNDLYRQQFYNKCQIKNMVI
ncbi:hypothetical protein K501DRAFT_273379 [Backusella circina FSU 941]|nr:hypothetical protein K501DRAFT_273379 [Backusella circina FSU 941]